MRFNFRILILMVSLIFSSPTWSTSLFHGYITDLSPPYICKLKLKKARGVSLETKHGYQFSGICSIKIPVGNTWIYQNVWVDVLADWNGETNEGFETATLTNNQGAVLVQLKCDDDPWLTKAQCSLVGYENNTQFSNLGGVFNPRTGQYPPFEISTGQYPPLARNQAILKEAIALSLLTASQEAAAAHAQFDQTFGQAQISVPAITPRSPIRKRLTQIFKKPKVGNVRLDSCLRLNQDCGKPAADEYCRSKGFRHSANCKVDTQPCSPTFIIGSQTISTQSFCKGFDEIECE